MWWSRPLSFVFALLVALSLSGCFQPLYSEAAHPGMVEDLRAIEVAPIPNRIGHYLAEDLIADLNGTGQAATLPKYRLAVTISTGTQTPTVNSEIGVASEKIERTSSVQPGQIPGTKPPRFACRMPATSVPCVQAALTGLMHVASIRPGSTRKFSTVSSR